MSRPHTTSPTSFDDGFSLPSSLFTRRYLGNPNWFLFLPLLRCFTSRGTRPQMGTHELIRPVKEVLFGDPRVFDCMHLTGA